MNSSLMTADAVTHARIVMLALVAGLCVTWIAISAHVTDRQSSAMIVAPDPAMPKVVMPQLRPVEADLTIAA